MNKSEVATRIVSGALIPIIRTPTTEDARIIANTVIEGGISTVEITMGVPDAVSLIKELSQQHGDQVLLGAGTVLNSEMARECIDAGARFIVSPSIDIQTIRYCNYAETLVVPGALSPTEIVTAWDAGADLVKVFPITAVGGAKYLKLIKGPLPHVRVIATGGVDQATAGELLAAGAEAVGVGADLVDVQAAREGRLTDIKAAARKYLAIVKEARKAMSA
jgi:2-dehydro-3-deoxyphosphogluconate aldolase/(4S)-4-hydroxy-2-oxoglutarate aldolase